MNLERGDKFEVGNDTLYIVGFEKKTTRYDTEEGAEWGDVEVCLCRMWDDYGPMPPFWSEKVDEFLEKADEVE